MAARKKKDEYKFTKDQLVKSKRYIEYRDILEAILEKDEVHSFSEVDEKIDNFLKGDR